MITLRQSSLRTFMECRRKFYLEVVLNLEHERNQVRPRRHTTADTGTLMHEVLRRYYTGELPEGATREDVYDICLSKAEEIGGIHEETTEVTSLFLPDWYKAIEVATIASHNYIPWAEDGRDLRFLPTSVEERMSYEVPGTGVTLTGQPDLVLLDELIGELGILDHKSVASLDAPRPGDFQLLTYSWLYWMTTGDIPGWAGHNQLKRNKQTAKAKPPFYARQPVHIDENILTLHGEMIHSLCHDIASFMLRVNEENHRSMAYPNMSGECSWKCGVQELCDLFHDGDDVWQSTAETYFIQRKDHN